MEYKYGKENKDGDEEEEDDEDDEEEEGVAAVVVVVVTTDCEHCENPVVIVLVLQVDPGIPSK